MKRKNIYLATPCCQAKCVYPCATCVGCECATDDFTFMFDNSVNIFCFL